MDYYFTSIYMVKIFIALTLEKDFNDQIIEIKKELKANLLKGANISWQRNDQHHLTVYFVGEMEPEQISQLNEGLAKINLTGFSRSIDLTAISFFPNETSQVLAAIVKPDSHLRNLHQEVEKVAVNIGFGSELKAYKPHITLGRFKEKNRPQYEFGRFDEPFKGKVKQLEVFESEFDKGKTEYTLLKSFKF
jgi:RNA 2',3'-cyclic 3'-phosphodiesterase